MVRFFLRAIALSFALICAFASPTSAQEGGGRRIVVERFRGPRASRIRDLLVADLRQHGWDVVGSAEVTRAERRLGGRRRRRREIDRPALARALRAEAFVSGTVSRQRRAWRLTVRVRGAHGDVVGTDVWSGPTTGAIAVVGRNGAARLRRPLERAVGGSTATTPDPPEETTAATPTAPVATAPRVGDAPPPPDDELAEDDEPDEPIDEDEPELPEPDDRGRFDSFRIALSAGSLWRSMNTTATVYAVRRGQPAADPATALFDEQRGYVSSGIGHAELGAEAEMYPGAFGDQSFPWLGVLASLRHSVALTSFGCRRTAAECAGAGQIEIPTEQLDVQAGLRGRYRFGGRRGDFELLFEGLWGLSSFTLDSNALQQIDFDAVIPPVEHHYVALGAGFQVALVPDALSVMARADYRIGILLNAVAREVWGVQTEPANGFLASFEIRHDATWLADGAFLALRGEYFQFSTSYRGQVGCANPGTCPDVPPDQLFTDDNPWEPWPVDANGRVVGGIADPVVDHYVRWGVYLGYAFR